MRTFKIREIRNLIPFFFCLPGQQRWYKWNIGISEIIPELTINFLPERKRKGSVLFLSLSLSSSLALALFLSVQQFDKATSVSASKGIKRDYWTVDWITAFSRGFPSFECKARRINFRVGRRFYGGTRTRNYRKEENSRGEERTKRKNLCRCRASRLLRPSLSFPRNFHVGGRGKIHPPLKRLYTTYSPLFANRIYFHSIIASWMEAEASKGGQAPPFLRSIGLNLFLLAAPR